MRMPQATNGTNCLIMAAIPSAPYQARRFADAVLSKWGMEDLSMTVNLALSEMVTNAIKANGVVIDNPRYGEQYAALDPICVCLYRRDTLVVVEVWDVSRLPPVMRHADLDAENGRGILLIDAVTLEWGYRWPKSGGKVVWCTVM